MRVRVLVDIRKREVIGFGVGLDEGFIVDKGMGKKKVLKVKF